jgi:uncharacterized protein with FMN-binding domain
VRNGTKAFVGIVSLGVIAAGYQAGLAAEVSTGFSAAAPVIDQNQAVTPVSPAPVSTDPAATPATTTPASATTPTSAAAPNVVPTKTTAPAPVSTPKPKTSTAPAPAQDPEPATPGVSKNGSAVQYRYGTVQVAVTKANGKITAVNLLQEGATGGRQAAFTYLADLAVQANGSSFGNLSGATYTTDAFKQSLESALAKF